MRDLIDGLLRLLFPPRCQVCGALAPKPLCDACLSQVKRIRLPVCHCCGVPFDPQTQHGNLCADCRAGRRFDRCRSACQYIGPLRTAIHRFKYHGRTQLAGLLAELVVRALREGPEPGDTRDRYYRPPPQLDLSTLDAIVPVPLHPRRQRDRGFNQAALLAQEIARDLSLPVEPGLLRRVKDTPAQVGLSLRERQLNVRGAFSAAERGLIEGRSVLLVDDVCTTGATLNECAKTLKRSGAALVWAVTVARQVGDTLDRPNASQSR